jgi:predicted O-methyltransferase YrrM
VNFFLISIVCILGASAVFLADMRRRGLSFKRVSDWGALLILDLLCPTSVAGVILAQLATLIARGKTQHLQPLYSPEIWTVLAGTLILLFIWREGRRQTQFQRPFGIVAGESLILAGAYGLIELAIFGSFPGGISRVPAEILCVLWILAGGICIAVIVPPFVKKYEGHHILDRANNQGEIVQAEYMTPTPECPNPSLWRMVDSQTSELEVLDFLRTLVATLKPHLIVETGTFLGHSSIKMAEALAANGFGKIITIEYDPVIFASAKERIDASGLGKWIEYRNESSLETHIDGTIDILFCDSHLTIREQEIRRFLPQVDPRGLILVHDASSHFKVVRESALRLEQEGLISTILLPTPRGLVVAQKREGRK